VTFKAAVGFLLSVHDVTVMCALRVYCCALCSHEGASLPLAS